MEELSHINKEGKARMVDVGDKPDQRRVAVASGFICLGNDTIQLITDNEIKKGDVLTLAEIAGIQAAKRTSELIPLCHPLQLSQVLVETRIVKKEDRQGVEVTARVRCQGQTGVEMEALTAVSVALLTVYDMCKAVDKNMQINNIRLVEKRKL